MNPQYQTKHKYKKVTVVLGAVQAVYPAYQTCPGKQSVSPQLFRERISFSTAESAFAVLTAYPFITG
jgi:hypothetical protein